MRRARLRVPRRVFRFSKRYGIPMPIANRYSRASQEAYVRRRNRRLRYAGRSIASKHRRLRFASSGVFRTLPSFISLPVRTFYITQTSFDDFVADNLDIEEDVSFRSVPNRLQLFWRAVVSFKCFKKTANIPDCLILFNPDNSVAQLNDFTGVMLPIISLADTVSDVYRITYPIPSNDDSLVLIFFYLFIFPNACDTAITSRYASIY